MKETRRLWIDRLKAWICQGHILLITTGRRHHSTARPSVSGGPFLGCPNYLLQIISKIIYKLSSKLSVIQIIRN
jgi:hypothetical protein